MSSSELKKFLDSKIELYNSPSFIINDPISIPHLFKKKQDIEIAGLFAATLAWGQRKTIISKCRELMKLMDDAPHDFILHHQEKDLKRFENFKHRTFNFTDTLYFIHFLHHHFSKHSSLEDAFLPNEEKLLDHSPLPQRGVRGEVSEKKIFTMKLELNVGEALIRFHNLFFSLQDFPTRTRKHVPTPIRKSSCKRLNMYLRWLVRSDDCGVDFGIWKKISPSQLICPVDLHVERVARKLGLIKRKNADWQTAIELTDALKQFDAIDPVKYDFALFGLGVMEKFR